MATITASTGNWSDTTKWDLARIPIAGDDVIIPTGVTMTLDASTAAIPASGTTPLTSITCQGTGKMTLALNTAGTTRNIYVTTWTPGTGSSSNSALAITGSTANTLTITCTTINGGGAANVYGIYHNSTGTLAIVGNLTGGSGSGGNAIFNNSTGAVTVTNGTLTGGTGSLASAIYSNSTGAVTFTNVNLVNGSGSVAYIGKPPTWNNASNLNYIDFTNTGRSNRWVTQPTIAQVAAGVIIGDMTGTLAPGSGVQFDRGFN